MVSLFLKSLAMASKVLSQSAVDTSFPFPNFPFQIGEIGRLSKSMKKLEKELKNSDKLKNDQYRSKLQKSNDRSLALVKEAIDMVVAVGLLQLAPKKVTPRVTCAFGFASYLLLSVASISNKGKDNLNELP